MELVQEMLLYKLKGEGGADPYINFLANNAQHWSLGVDDSDSDKV